jgi:hypothetical protein
LYSFTFKSIASRERRLTGDVFRTANFWFWPVRAFRGRYCPPSARHDPEQTMTTVRIVQMAV